MNAGTPMGPTSRGREKKESMGSKASMDASTGMCHVLVLVMPNSTASPLIPERVYPC